MKKYLKYDLKNQRISQILWDKTLTAKTESMMALGNGYLGLRSVDEECESFNKEDLFVNGIFNSEHKGEVSELANLSDLIKTSIQIDGTPLSLSIYDEYNKTLNIQNGILTREIKILRNKKKFLITFTRFVSQDIENIYAQKIVIMQLEGSDTNVSINPKINGQTTNSGAQHFKEGLKKRLDLNTVQYLEETTLSKRFVIHNLNVNADIDGNPIEAGTDNFIVTMARRQVGFKISTPLKTGQTLSLTKKMSVNTSIDSDDSISNIEKVKEKSLDIYKILSKESFETLVNKSNKKWEKIWKQFSIKIKGNNYDAKYDHLANMFAIYHMNSFVPKNNSNLSVAAKGLSGEGYQGHSFWDTEFFIMPNYLFTNPKIARNLLEFRYKGIEGARVKAKENKRREEESNLEGAQYPWEMAWPSDGEVCPYWGQADISTGKQVPIASRIQEIHVSADIAYAIDQYYDFTNDEEFMNDMGYEMIFDTAHFWTQRVEKNNGTYEIKNVMGPNEYKGEIDNNAFINYFARHNIELALKYKIKLENKNIKLLNRILSKIPYEISFDKMPDIIKNIKLQKPNNNSIIPENDQFLKLKRMEIDSFKMLGDAGKKLFNTKLGQKVLSCQLVKQADVVLLTHLLPQHFSNDVIKKNFDFYEPITTHDSSLSPTTYAIQAIELREMDIAYKLYKYSINIDLGENMKSCDAGIHSGSLAAIWQSTVFGYGGVKWFEGKLMINPILPKKWDGLEFTIRYKGVDMQINIKKTKFTIMALGNSSVKVLLGDKQEITVNSTKKEYEVINEN